MSRLRSQILPSVVATLIAAGLLSAQSIAQVGTIPARAVSTLSGLGANVATALAVAVGTDGAFVVKGGALGTPSSGVGTNLTGVPISTGVSGLGTGIAAKLAIASGAAGAVGNVVQVVKVEDGAVASGSTVLPMDDTIPQNTEGVQFMTLAITPTSATNLLKIDVVGHFASGTATRWIISGLFQDTTANALASGVTWTATADIIMEHRYTHYMTAGTTSSTTFKVRAGVDTSGTITFNGAATTRRLGGVIASSLTITEIAQ